jgi:hypothetical protein
MMKTEETIAALDQSYPAVGAYMLFALCLLMISVLLLIVAYAHRARSLQREQRYRELRFKYQYFIYDALVEGQSGDVQLGTQERIIARFKDDELTSAIRQQVMTNLLIELKKSFSGRAARQFEELYYALGLVHFSKTKLQKRDWQQKAAGLRELSEMQCTDPEVIQIVSRWQAHEQPLLAEEARIAAIRIKFVSLLELLDRQKEELLPMQALRMQHHFASLPEEEMPDFSRWLQSENESIVLFALKMIEEQQQATAYGEIPKLFAHSSERLVTRAIEAAGRLEVKSAVPALFNLLDHENEQIRIASLRAIGALGTQYHAELLQPIARHAAPCQRTAAASAIHHIRRRCEEQRPAIAPEISLNAH